MVQASEHSLTAGSTVHPGVVGDRVVVVTQTALSAVAQAAQPAGRRRNPGAWRAWKGLVLHPPGRRAVGDTAGWAACATLQRTASGCTAGSGVMIGPGRRQTERLSLRAHGTSPCGVLGGGPDLGHCGSALPVDDHAGSHCAPARVGGVRPFAFPRAEAAKDAERTSRGEFPGDTDLSQWGQDVTYDTMMEDERCGLEHTRARTTPTQALASQHCVEHGFFLRSEGKESFWQQARGSLRREIPRHGTRMKCPG